MNEICELKNIYTENMFVNKFMILHKNFRHEVSVYARIEYHDFSFLVVYFHTVLICIFFRFSQLLEHFTVFHGQGMPSPGMISVRLRSLAGRNRHNLLWKVNCFCQSHVIYILQVDLVCYFHVPFTCNDIPCIVQLALKAKVIDQNYEQ